VLGPQGRIIALALLEHLIQKLQSQVVVRNLRKHGNQQKKLPGLILVLLRLLKSTMMFGKGL